MAGDGSETMKRLGALIACAGTLLTGCASDGSNDSNVSVGVGMSYGYGGYYYGAPYYGGPYYPPPVVVVPPGERPPADQPRLAGVLRRSGA